MLREYETHSTLNPKLWKNGDLRPKLQIGFAKIAKAFYDFLEVDAEILDVILIGSNANYNYTEHSDIDLHVVINYMQVGDNLHVVRNYMHAKKSIWNVNYPLTYKGMNIELYAQDSNEVLNSTVGVYSIMHSKWVRRPSAETVSVDDAAIQQKAEPYEYEIDALSETDPYAEQKIKNLKQRLHHLRQTGLDAEGEYSLENMAYKHLRNKGYIERLKRLEQKIVRGRLAVEQRVNELDIPKFANKTKDQVTRFVKAMRNETEETKHAMAMLLQHLNGEKLTPEEWQWVRGQMKDVLKLIGLTTMAVAPGGSLLAILVKALKMDKHILPSSFQTQDDVAEAFRRHVSKEKLLDETAWADIIAKTDAVVDPRGQWDHPGRCTMIPTEDGRITMKGVPHPVTGIDNTGHMILMQPEQEYTYPGLQVFEIPHTAQWQTLAMQLQNSIRNGSMYAK